MTDEERMAAIKRAKRVVDAALVFTAAAGAAVEASQALVHALEAIGDEAHAAPPVEQAAPPVDTSSIRALLASLFTADEVHRFSRHNTPTITGKIAWNRTSLNAIVFDYIGALERNGILAVFFDALVRARPGREREIRKVQADHNAGANAYA